MLIKEKKEINKFIISYLRYLLIEDLNKWNEELENNKITETTPPKEEENNNTII
jgi:hypothetical protein